MRMHALCRWEAGLCRSILAQRDEDGWSGVHCQATIARQAGEIAALEEELSKAQPPAPAASAPGLGSPPPHLHRDWARPRHICAGTGLTTPTSAPGLQLRSEVSEMRLVRERLKRREAQVGATACVGSCR